MESDAKDLKQLGSNKTEYRYDKPSADILETFPNPKTDGPYRIEHTFHEFTSLCPKTGQPDFAVVYLYYIPISRCVETKSLKLYYFSYRNHGAFMERIVNEIADDLVVALGKVRHLVVTCEFSPRGGIATRVAASRCSDECDPGDDEEDTPIEPIHELVDEDSDLLDRIRKIEEDGKERHERVMEELARMNSNREMLSI